jgi:hypothetical protein
MKHNGFTLGPNEIALENRRNDFNNMMAELGRDDNMIDLRRDKSVIKQQLMDIGEKIGEPRSSYPKTFDELYSTKTYSQLDPIDEKDFTYYTLRGNFGYSYTKTYAPAIYKVVFIDLEDDKCD